MPECQKAGKKLSAIGIFTVRPLCQFNICISVPLHGDRLTRGIAQLCNLALSSYLVLDAHLWFWSIWARSQGIWKKNLSVLVHWYWPPSTFPPSVPDNPSISLRALKWCRYTFMKKNNRKNNEKFHNEIFCNTIWYELIYTVVWCNVLWISSRKCRSLVPERQACGNMGGGGGGGKDIILWQCRHERGHCNNCISK
jgi:hypothetical protein